MLQLYKNIRKRRQELGLTQNDLAKLVGYSGKSMIARIEKGDVDLPADKIMTIAEALRTSPSDLMGNEGTLDAMLEIPEVKDLLIGFQELNGDGRRKLLEYLDDLIDMKKYRR